MMADVFADERPFSDQEFDAFLDNVSCVLDTNSGYETMAFPEDCVGLEAPMSASLHATSSHKVLTGADLSDTARGYLSCESLLDDSILHLPQVPSIVIDTTPAATARHGSQQAHGQSLNGSRDPYLEQTPQDGAAGTQSGAHKPAKRSLESSRKAQRRYRARQKALVQQLQEELANGKATIARLQSEIDSAKCQALATSALPQVFRQTPQIQNIAYQASDMPDATIISVLHAPWTSWASLVTCDSQPHEAEAYQQVAKLSFPELALYRQEFSCLHTVHTKVSPLGWSHFHKFEGPKDEASEGMATFAPQGDMPALLRMLQVTDAQKAASRIALRQYLSTVKNIAKQRKLLLQQMQDMPDVGLDCSHFVASSAKEEDLLRKLHACTLQANAAFVWLQGITGHQILTVWQTCVAICHSYPQSPDVLAMVNAVVNEADIAETTCSSIDVANSDPGLLHHTSASAWREDIQPHTLIGHDLTATGCAPNEIEAQDIFG